MSESFIRAIGGAPMIDEDVDSSTLFWLACEKRRRIDGSRQWINFYASPTEAKNVYKGVCRNLMTVEEYEEYASINIDAKRQQMILGMMDEIAEAVPEWKSYFKIPIRWRLLTIPNVISYTAPHIPQSIFFGENAFENPRILREQIVHEMSHVWMSLTLEITPWTHYSETTFVLPSKISNRKIWQVILALCFSVSAIKLYHRLITKGNAGPEDLKRVRWAFAYAQGCIETALSSGLLAENGIEIINSCEREINFAADDCGVGITSILQR